MPIHVMTGQHVVLALTLLMVVSFGAMLVYIRRTGNSHMVTQLLLVIQPGWCGGDCPSGKRDSLSGDQLLGGHAHHGFCDAEPTLGGAVGHWLHRFTASAPCCSLSSWGGLHTNGQ